MHGELRSPVDDHEVARFLRLVPVRVHAYSLPCISDMIQVHINLIRLGWVQVGTHKGPHTGTGVVQVRTVDRSYR